MKANYEEVMGVYHKVLKQMPTKAEVELLNYLKKGKKKKRLEFVFQHRLGDYFYDFYFRNKRLIIELDGGYHKYDNVQIHDLKKDRFAGDMGIKVCHVSNWRVYREPHVILKDIKSVPDQDPVENDGVIDWKAIHMENRIYGYLIDFMINCGQLNTHKPGGRDEGCNDKLA